MFWTENQTVVLPAGVSDAGHEIVNDIEDNETIYIPEEISEELKRINNAEKTRKKVMSIANII